ncbi:MAG: hypothetical protein H7Z41_09350, partial [Cytophagales bacterium]|nr:hypothetical protein [Armatimonadota bacterium]
MLAHAGPEWAPYVANPNMGAAFYYVQALDKLGNRAALVAGTRRVLTELPTAMDDRGDWAYAKLCDLLAADGHPEEALRFAKQRFLLCSYEKGTIDRSARMLAKVMGAVDSSQGLALRFVQAQGDSKSVNPLKSVKLPDESLATATRLLTDGYKTDLHGRVSLQLLDESSEEAAVTASGSLREACRCLKARDLGITSANTAAADRSKTGAGTSGAAVDPVAPEVLSAPFVGGCIAAERSLPDEVWTGGKLTADLLYYLMDHWWFRQAGRLEVARELVQRFPPVPEPEPKTSSKLRLWLGDYFRSINDPRAVPYLESVLAETKSASGKEPAPALLLLGQYYEQTKNFQKAAETFASVEKYTSHTDFIPDL